MQTVLITGGTGLIGQALTTHFTQNGYRVIILTRSLIQSKHPLIQCAYWNVNRHVMDREAIMQADIVIHLAGANVAEKRWTSARKKEIEESRVQSGKLLVDSLNKLPNKVHTLISSSAIGWYGADVNTAEPFTEEAAFANDFLGITCKRWEDSITENLPAKIRLVILRTGIVLSNKAGAFTEFAKPFKLGICPILGTGKQLVSWIHIDDIVAMYAYAAKNKAISGVFNAVAPQPASNKSIMVAIKNELASKAITIHVPSFLLKIILGEMSVEVLKSCTVSPNKIIQTGFAFSYTNIAQATRQLIHNK